jgi:ankyrin repeat protein
LEHGSAVNTIGGDGKGLLHYVCELWDDEVVEVARFLLAHGIPADTQDYRGKTPLMYAASHGGLSALKFLLEKGASVNARSHSGWSALMYAAMGKEGKAVRFLLEQGASITVDDLKSLQFFKDDMIKAGFYWELQEAAYRRQATAN